eukprot:TRINITY_DN4609_c0_g1_i1.p1 TRINITY_DN4609_c0_g1~~TRINITY_DN4609_c0_g1_i1.p1  ORF type:complete len:278 (-),score=58.52 TRINITY_DN4609_c0_g1_i1:172-1005(-)
MAGKVHDNQTPRWLAISPVKRDTEILFLKLSAVWIAWFGLIVVTKAYEACGDLGYMLIGLGTALPYILVPLLFPVKGEESVPIYDRYWFKANVWIAIFGFVGNYFWTHYFYKVLGAGYSFPVVIELNEVPVFLYLITHAYFCFYHVVTTVLLRRFWTSRFYMSKTPFPRMFLSSLVVFIMAYITAFMETLTIASVPYYTHNNKFLMYTVGSAFYGIYFIYSFPMFYRLDETSGDRWHWTRAVIDSLAASMAVTITLDLWRLCLGGLEGVQPGLPWLN